jgi:hypothetical protein
MFRHPLVRDIAWVSVAKLLVLTLIYLLFFTPNSHAPVGAMVHIAGARPSNAALAR